MKVNYRFDSIYNLVISSIGLLLGLLLIFMQDAIIYIIYSIIGFVVIASAIARLYLNSFSFSEKNKTIVLIDVIISICLGIVILLFPYQIIGLILGIYLIVSPIYRIIISNNRKQTFKDEVLKLSFGVILIILGPYGELQVLFYLAGGIIILSSLASLIIYLIILLKTRKIQRKEKKDNEVIDV